MQVKLSLVERTPEAVVVRYETTNDGGRTVYLVNRLYHTEPSGVRHLDPNVVYASVDDGTLVLAKRMVDVPEDLEVEIPEVPYLTAVEPGARFVEDVRLELPVTERHPYRRLSRAGEPSERTCSQVILALGVFVPESDDWVRTVQLGDTTALSADHGHVVKRQRVLVSAPLPLRIPCRVVQSKR